MVQQLHPEVFEYKCEERVSRQSKATLTERLEDGNLPHLPRRPMLPSSLDPLHELSPRDLLGGDQSLDLGRIHLRFGPLGSGSGHLSQGSAIWIWKDFRRTLDLVSGGERKNLMNSGSDLEKGKNVIAQNFKFSWKLKLYYLLWIFWNLKAFP